MRNENNIHVHNKKRVKFNTSAKYSIKDRVYSCTIKYDKEEFSAGRSKQKKKKNK